MPETARSEKFLAAEQALPEESRPVFRRLVDEYQYHAHVIGGFPWAAYKILAALVRDGWRPSPEPIEDCKHGHLASGRMGVCYECFEAIEEKIKRRRGERAERAPAEQAE